MLTRRQLVGGSLYLTPMIAGLEISAPHCVRMLRTSSRKLVYEKHNVLAGKIELPTRIISTSTSQQEMVMDEVHFSEGNKGLKYQLVISDDLGNILLEKDFAKISGLLDQNLLPTS